jgi:hypothetical protein
MPESSRMKLARVCRVVDKFIIGGLFFVKGFSKNKMHNWFCSNFAQNQPEGEFCAMLGQKLFESCVFYFCPTTKGFSKKENTQLVLFHY